MIKWNRIYDACFMSHDETLKNADRLSERLHQIQKIGRHFEDRIFGAKGAPKRRRRFEEQAIKTLTFPYPQKSRGEIPTWKRQALGLADMAGQYYDEHGYQRGDYHSTEPLDYVHPKRTKGAPYHDMGGAGLALVAVHRERHYAKSYQYGPGRAHQKYLVGRNEAGTFFAHPVPKTVESVEEACQWIWQGHAGDIVQRQGDIALIRGAGPKIPKEGLPEGHQIVEGSIVHETHPPIRYPGKGERVIVGRRAKALVSEATRD